MSIDVFNRFEQKYLLDQFQYERILEKINYYMVLDGYNQKNGFYTISNIYYDTRDDLLIKKSLSKPIYKEKMRLRAYGIPNLNSDVYMEIKKKYNGLVNKRRTTIKLNDAYDYISNRKRPQQSPIHNLQVLNEIDYFLSRYNVIPTVYIAYDRKAYTLGDFRVTFDRNIRTRRFDLNLEMGTYGTPLLLENQWLMEVKSEYALPLWFVKCLSENHLYATSFSKYGSEFKQNNEKSHFNVEGETQTCMSPFFSQQTARR